MNDPKFTHLDRQDILEALQLWKSAEISKARAAGMTGLTPVLLIDMRRQALLAKIGIDPHRGILCKECPL